MLAKNFIEWFDRVVRCFLYIAVVFIGVGRIEVPFVGWRVSSWSVSRTTFFFWLMVKIFVWYRTRRAPLDLTPKTLSVPLFLFAGWVSASLFPSFTDLGDYRYLMFAMAHYLMVVDVFADEKRQTLLYSLLAITPGVLLLRGIYADPAILSLSLTSRFAYPIAHANPAGFLFAMSIPLCLAMVLRSGKWLRQLAVLSLLSQFGALILTFSRTAWFASCASLLSVGAVDKKLRAVVLVVGFVVIGLFGVSAELRGRILSLTDAANDPFVIYRAQVMKHTIAVGLDQPIFGSGYGRDHIRAALKEHFPEFTTAQGFVGHSHNFYSELIGGVGLAGLAIFLWLVGSAGILLLKKAAARDISEEENYALLGLFGALIAFVVASIGDIPFYFHEPRMFFFTLLGLITLRLRA